MKRIIMVLAVGALMAVMLVAMAAPAIASKFPFMQEGSCGSKGATEDVFGADFITGSSLGGGGDDQFHVCKNEPNNS